MEDWKESNPIEVAEYAIVRKINAETPFLWWVPYTLRKKKRIIAMVRTRLKANTHKFGIEIPRNITHAQRLDEENENTLWMDALAKEMFNVSVRFETLEYTKMDPVGWTKTLVHLILDLRTDFT